MQLERPEFSYVFSFAHRRKDYYSSIFPESNGMNEIYRDDLNYFSVALPFKAFDKNMVVSLNYQRLYDFYDNIEFDQNYDGFMSDGSFWRMETHERFKQTGALKAFAPAFAIQITPRFSLGITFNFWTDNLGYDNGWEIKRETTGTGYIHTATNRLLISRQKLIYEEKNENFEGFNVNIGFLWHINRVVTLGAVLKTPFTADVNRKTYALSTPVFVGTPAMQSRPFRSRESIELHFPMSYGIGLAFRLSDKFTVACDVYRTNWSDFWVKSQQGRTSPITGGSRGNAHTHDTTQVRLGCEYLFILERTLVPLRFGVFYDPEPSSKNPDDFYGASIGTGIMIGNIVLDCCYIYRWGRDVKGDVIEQTRSRADVDQHKIYVSMIYHF
jgi:long-subunit fatty acid transport protein